MSQIVTGLVRRTWGQRLHLIYIFLDEISCYCLGVITNTYEAKSWILVLLVPISNLVFATCFPSCFHFVRFFYFQSAELLPFLRE